MGSKWKGVTTTMSWKEMKSKRVMKWSGETLSLSRLYHDPCSERGGCNKVDGVWLWSGLRLGAVSCVRDEHRSVLSDSNTPQSTLGFGSAPAQWQKPLISAIPHLASVPSAVVFGEPRLWSQLRGTYNVSIQVVRALNHIFHPRNVRRVYSERSH